ncbi:conjugative transposon protein TraN [Aestuariibaculum sp. M13]|uniref:conjugative transposon protein TraN n=1 Tax=Aestuariibaculum sp. M13 TaxID=2967132 RepID=UPI00215A0B70|nr:conjugative transposon protein TraN [Aestuariibaculum sp. M13]MCR8667492.1 conjugative transposon protein TraN [Aestuariibaculum sp. M13]
MRILNMIAIPFLMSLTLNAQHLKPLDTIYANDKMNVALFFPDYIRQGITGSEDFVFTYNREKKQYFGLLQARPGHQSNLLAVTDNGQVYSYIVKYKDSITRLNYFVSESESIGNEIPEIPIKESIINEDSLTIKKHQYYERFSQYLLGQDYFAERTKRKKGVVLKLLETRYQNNEVYLVFDIKNKSEIDFEIDYLKVYRVSSNKKRKASYQQLELDVIYKCEFPKKVVIGNSQMFVYVLTKFSMGDNERLEISILEKNGNRKIAL